MEKDRIDEFQNLATRIVDKHLCPKSPISFEKALKNVIEDLLVYRDREQITEDDELYAEIDALIMLIQQYIAYLDPHDRDDKREEDSELFDMFRTILEELDEFEEKKHPELSNYPTFRIKHFFSFWEKIWRNGSTPKKALSKVKDLLALRFIIKNESATDKVSECFIVHHELVKYLETNYNAIQIDVSSQLKDVEKFDITKFEPGYMYVPTDDEIPDLESTKKAKNYIQHPKENGYQAIQSVLYFVDKNIYVEIQVLTQTMFDNNENGEANHDESYKAAIYHQTKKKHMPSGGYKRYNNIIGFKSRDGKTFTDLIGLWKARIYHP